MDRPTNLRGPTALALLLGLAGAAHAQGTFEEVRDFGPNPGALKMWVHRPPQPATPAGVVVALHPCTVTAAQFHENAGWAALADAHGFYVIYPEQQSANNPLGCFNWAGEYGDPTNLRRGEGENQSIIEMVGWMQGHDAIDDAKVFVMGHSGGGAQAAVMLATWPDVFAAGATMAGIAYNCTTNFNQVSSCLTPGIPRSAQAWGDAVRAANPNYRGPWPRLSVWQGSADNVVAPVNQAELVKQWTNVHGIDDAPDGEDQVDGYPHRVYRDAQGRTLVETYTMTGQGHGTFVDPPECGQAGAYFLAAHICAVDHMATFFGLIDDGSVDPPPADLTVDVSTPVDGATVTGTVRVEAGVQNPDGAASVEFFVDGDARAVADEAPYAFDWDTAADGAGPHALKAVATDDGGRTATDDDTGVTVVACADEAPPTVSVTAPEDGGVVRGQVAITADAADDCGVRVVEFAVDGQPVGESAAPPFGATWSASAGEHTLTATAVDVAGNRAEASVSVTVDEGAPPPAGPAVMFTAPAEGATVRGVQRFAVDAHAEGGVTQVLLFLGDALVGVDRAGPTFDFLWDAGLADEGPHTLTARAFDADGNIGEAERTVVVSHAPEVEGDAGGGPGVGDAGAAGASDTEPRKIGKTFWGCNQGMGRPGASTSAPDRPSPMAWTLLVALGLLGLRRRQRTERER